MNIRTYDIAPYKVEWHQRRPLAYFFILQNKQVVTMHSITDRMNQLHHRN